MMDALAHDLQRPVREILEEILRRTGLEETFGRDDEDSRQARANVDELITAAAEFDEEEHEAPLEEYLQQVSLVSDVDHFEGGGGSVTLMTLHTAKGLEFPVVFIVGCEEEILPWNRGGKVPGEGENLQELEEERRLAFVGMTRAKEHLTLTSARHRRIRGQRHPQTASRFLHEIGGEAVRVEDLTNPSVPRRRGGRGGFHAETDERIAIESMENAREAAVDRALAAEAIYHDDADEGETPFPPEYEHLRPGCMVHHAKFGVGKLVKLSGRWPETRGEVMFHECGKKRLVLARTHLEIVDGEY
jgi:DNA helicase-2/ATP-dependent DNA helicase PcrA